MITHPKTALFAYEQFANGYEVYITHDNTYFPEKPYRIRVYDDKRNHLYDEGDELFKLASPKEANSLLEKFQTIITNE